MKVTWRIYADGLWIGLHRMHRTHGIRNRTRERADDSR